MPVSLAYEEILANYIAELRAARDEAVAWWARLVAREMAEGRNPFEAEHQCRMRWPMGPTSHPRIIEVFRRHYFAIIAVNTDYQDRNESDDDFNDMDLWNATVDEDDEEESLLAEPLELLLEELGRRDEGLQQFMRYLVFIPVGADQEGMLR